MLLSSSTILLNRICLLWIIAYFLVVSPTAVYSSVPVVLLGQSAGLPHLYEQEEGADLTGLLALALIIMAVEDFSCLFAENPLPRQRAVVPLRLVVFFAVTAAAYLRMGAFGNSFVLTYGIGELMLNFWLYIAVREENNERIRTTIIANRGDKHP